MYHAKAQREKKIMKTLSSNTATAVDAPNVAPILLVQIAFTSPAALTLYLCSRPFDDRNTYDGDCYDPLIASWSPIRQGAVDPVNWFTNAGDMTLNILNNIPVGGYPSFSGLLAHYDWAFAEVTVMQAHEDALAADDHVALFAGFVENPDGMDRAVVTLTVSGRELAYSEKWPVAFVTTDDYPNADPDDVGKMLPQCWGPCKRAPFMAVAAGWITTLAEDIGADTLGAVEFTDVGGLPAAGSIQIGDEIISYSAKSEEDSTLTLDQRGYDDTVPSVHNRGENVAEIRTEYCYILDHAVHAINAVYVAGVLVSDEDTFTAYGPGRGPACGLRGKGVHRLLGPAPDRQAGQPGDRGHHHHLRGPTQPYRERGQLHAGHGRHARGLHAHL